MRKGFVYKNLFVILQPCKDYMPKPNSWKNPYDMSLWHLRFYVEADSLSAPAETVMSSPAVFDGQTSNKYKNNTINNEKESFIRKIAYGGG